MKDFTEPFRNTAQADSFRSELLAAARKGEAFSTVTGRPMSWKRVSSEMTWYDFACAYTDMNRPRPAFHGVRVPPLRRSPNPKRRARRRTSSQ